MPQRSRLHLACAICSDQAISSIDVPESRETGMISLDRRSILAGAAAALALRGLAARAAALPGPTDGFVDSVGVNVHIASPPYAARFDRFHELIGASGIRHLRDELRPSNDLGRWRALNARSGVQFNVLVSPATNTVPEMMAYLDALGVDCISAIEGQNEGDSDWFMALPLAKSGWSDVVVAYQRDVHRALRARYSVAQLPLLSPSVIDWKPADVTLLKGAAEFSDAVAIHSYVQHAEEPETTDDHAAVAWYLHNMRDAFKPGAPALATECGYCNLVRHGGSGVSEAAAAIYLPRLLLNNYRLGILRTFLYEFIDGGTDPNDSEMHWGLVRNDGTPKPSYLAISNLIAALKDAARAAPSPMLQVAPASMSPELRQLAFEDSAGRPLLAVWRAVPCWNRWLAHDVAVEPVAVDLTVGAPGTSPSLAMMRPNDNADWQPVATSGQHATIPLDGRVVIIRAAA
jgi:hypothetical protein